MTDTVLYLAHPEAQGSLSRPSLEALTTALSMAAGLKAPLVVGLFGGLVQPAASVIGGFGATRILGIEGADFADPCYAGDAMCVEALARESNATIVVAAHTSRLARVLAGVAVRLNGAIDTHVSAVNISDGSVTASRCFYRQRIEGSLQRTQRPWFLLMDPGAAPAYAAAPSPVQVATLSVTVPPARTQTIGLRETSAGEQTIRPDAALLFVAGAGWTRKQKDGQPHVEQAEQLILNFLRSSGASLGSTKSLTDSAGSGDAVLHCLSHLNQVGQTGSTPRHGKGLSTCCHGEEPHVVGWRFIRERRAVNLDPSCGWARGKADVLYVADAFQVMHLLNERFASPEVRSEPHPSVGDEVQTETVLQN
jgi:electron transfer flavoprotein alpha subunit